MKWSKVYSIGESKLEAGETRDAIRYFKKALVIAQKNVSKQEEAVTLGRLGNIYLDIENYHEAVDYYEKGLEIVQETGDKKLECLLCSGIGTACDKLGDYEKFMEYSKQGFNVALRIGDPSFTAISYGDLGRAYNSLRDYQKSIKCHKRAIDLFKQLNDEGALGVAYLNMSISYERQGKYHDAIRLLDESLGISVKLGSKENQATGLLNSGAIYSRLHEVDKAVEMFQNSLAISIEIGHKGLQARCYVGLGNVLFHYYDEYSEAISVYQKCLEIAVEIDDKQSQAQAISDIGDCLQQLKRYEEANRHYSKSLTIAKEMHDKSTEARIYHSLGVNDMRALHFHTALNLLEKCLDIASTIDNKECAAGACASLGHLHYLLHKENQAHQACHNTDDIIATSEQYLRKALDCFDFLFQHLHQQDDFKVSIFDRFNETYKFLTTVLIETKQLQEAVLVSDGGRARALGDRLVFKYGMIQNEMSLPKSLAYPDVKAIFFKDVFSILHYSLLSDSLAVWVLAKDAPMVFRETEKEQFDSVIETLTEEKKDGDGNSIKRFFTATVSRAYETMKIQESATCENRSLDDCVTSKDHVTTKASESLSRDDGTSEENLDQASHPLEMLYNCLVAPVLSDVRHDEIVIVPDGPMYRVPFAALRDPNTGQYLSDTKRIRLAPSIAVLKTLNECPVDHHSQKGALIVGDPSVGEVMFRGKKRVFERLHSAETEVRFISYKLGQAALTGEQATKNTVLHKLREGSALIHIAAHGSSDNGEIALAPNVSPERQGIPEEDDYLLTMKEVQEIGIKAQLVVLSCCYSGRGKIRAEGMVGLSRAFLAAGARSVVASLWAIDDVITLCFMLKFYGYLTRGESASVSLHKAMLDIRAEEGQRDPKYRDPKYWAPFFLIGDDVTLNLKLCAKTPTQGSRH